MDIIRWWDIARNGTWLTGFRKPQLYWWTLALAGVSVGTLIFHAATDRNIDFTAFYAAAQLASRGHAALVYDPASLYAAERAAALNSWAFQYNCFLYPPIALLVLRPLALFPYPTALLIWSAAQLAAAAMVFRRTLGRSGPMVYLVAFPAMWYSVKLGQNGLLSVAIFGAAALALRADRPMTAGGLFAFLAYKPQLVLAIPTALIAGRQYRALVAFLLGLTALSALSIWLDGPATWRAFLVELFHGAGTIYGTETALPPLPGSLAVVVPTTTILSAYGAALSIGFTKGSAAMFQLVIAAGAIVTSASIWRNADRIEPRVLSLIAAILLTAPLFMLYDAELCTIAVAWVWRDRQATGWLPWEATGFLVIYIFSLTFYCVGGIQLGWLNGLFILWISHRRAKYPVASTPEFSAQSFVAVPQ
jgi:hypothetical protein